MIAGNPKEIDDYYGYNSVISPTGKRLRRMKRTELSNEKKSNNSSKSLSKKNSSLSILKSKVTNKDSINLKASNIDSLKNSTSRLNQNVNPSSTDFRDHNASTGPSSVRKSRLQLNTGVVGIKMQSLSPSFTISQPSKVVFVNESSQKKKGSKIRKQKSIIYVEYNNFMTELNSQNQSLKDSKKFMSKAINRQRSRSRQVPNGKNNPKQQQKQGFTVKDLQNQYFFGSNRNAIPNVANQKDKSRNQNTTKEHLTNGSGRNQVNISNPKLNSTKNEVTLANLSVTSNYKEQNVKNTILSPKIRKIEQSTVENKKTKIYMQDIVSMRQKYISSNEQKDCSKPIQIPKVEKIVKNSQTISKTTILQAKVAHNQSSAPSKRRVMNLVSDYNIEKIESSNQLGSSSQKTIKFSNYTSNKQYKTQKSIVPLQNRIGLHRASLESNMIQNPYSLNKNDNLVNKFNKNKQKTEFLGDKFTKKESFDSLTTKFRQKTISQVSQSVKSISSSKRGRKLLRSGTNSKSGSKISLTPSKQKLKMNLNQKITEPKTPQPQSNYRNEQINTPKTGQNKQSENANKRQKVINDYNPNYYTPNPHIQEFCKQSSKKNNQNQFGQNDQNNGSSVISGLSGDNSQFQNFQNESSNSECESHQSVISCNKSNVSQSKFKRQQILRKSKLKSSRISQKSSKSGSVNIVLNPSKVSESLKNSSINNVQIFKSKAGIYQSLTNNARISAFQDKQIMKSYRKMEQDDDMNDSKPKFKLVKVVENTNLELKDSKKLQNCKEIQNTQMKQESLVQFHQDYQQKYRKRARKDPIQTLSPVQKGNFYKQSMHKDCQLGYNQLGYNQLGYKKEVFDQTCKDASRLFSQKISNVASDKGLINSSKPQFYIHLNEAQSITNRLSRHSSNEQSEQQQSDQQFISNSDDSGKYEQQSHKIKLQQSQKNIPPSNQLNTKVTSVQDKSSKPNATSNKNIIQRHHKDSDEFNEEIELDKSGKHSKRAKNQSNSNSQSIIASKLHKSILIIKSGRNLKPLSLENPKIQEFIEYLEEYEISIGFLYLYTENTTELYCSVNQEQSAKKNSNDAEKWKNNSKSKKSKKFQQKYEKLSFLMMKKFLYEKNRMIKCLRGLQSNIFNLTGLQIPNNILKKFIGHQQTNQKLKQFELQTKELFKKLQEQFRSLRLKAENKKDPLIKLETPYDNFTRDIVSMLLDELNELTAQIDALEEETSSQISSQNPSLPIRGKKVSKPKKSLTSVIAQQIFSNQERCVEIIQIVFLLSQLQSRKIKKLELINIQDIDFESYYENYIEKLLGTYQFFEELKYPSDEQQKKKKK